MMMKSFILQQPPALEENMSNLTTSASGDASVSSGNRTETGANYPHQPQFSTVPPSQPGKKKRNLPGNPDPDAEVIALSPRSLLATNRFVCEICNKGFQRDQNLQLHRRGHNLPWKLKTRTNKEVRKKVYVCPEPSCVHHDPSRALGDLTGIKKHFCRKHGEKKWKCEKCSKKYAVQSDWKAHSKICGTREYRCDCGTLFSRRDSFITHRAFCDALAEESARAITTNPLLISSIVPGSSSSTHINIQQNHHFNPQDFHSFSFKKEQQSFVLKPNNDHNIPPWLACQPVPCPGPPPAAPIDVSSNQSRFPVVFSTRMDHHHHHHQESHLNIQNPNPSEGPSLPPFGQSPSSHMSATALLQRAAQMGPAMMNDVARAGPSSSSQAMDVMNYTRPHQHRNPDHVSADSSGNINNNVNNTAGFGVNLESSRDHQQQMSGTGNYVQDVMAMASSLSSASTGFQGASFEDAFGGMFGSKKEEGLLHFSSRSNLEGDQELTRDFLGLRHLSHSEMLNIASLANSINTSDHQAGHPSQSQKPWQG